MDDRVELQGEELSQIQDAREEALKEFEKDVERAASGILSSHEDYDAAKRVNKRSIYPKSTQFTTDHHIHHSYIFDILPDNIHDLFVDGAEYVAKGVKKLSKVTSLSYLPILNPDNSRGDLLVTYDKRSISFLIYKKNGDIEHICQPLTLSYDILSFVIVFKSLYRLDLDRVLVVESNSRHRHSFQFFRVRSATIPNNGDIYEIICEDIIYKREENVLSYSASYGHVNSYVGPKKSVVWLTVLVKRGKQKVIDVYAILKFDKVNYRSSIAAVFDCRLEAVNRIKVFKLLEFIVIFEIGVSWRIEVTAFVASNDRIVKPTHTTLRIPSNSTVTHVETFSYGSRSFVLIANTGGTQYVKEVVSYGGNGLKFFDFDRLEYPHGEKWLMVNVPGCRDEKLVYLFHTESGVKKIQIHKLDKHGLVKVRTQRTCPAYFLAPGPSGRFDHTGNRLHALEEARKACLEDITCTGIQEQRPKNYVLGYLNFEPKNDTKEKCKVLLKQSTVDAPDLYCLLRNGDPIYSSLAAFSSARKSYMFVKLISGKSYIVRLQTHFETKERKVVLQNALIYNVLHNLTTTVDNQQFTIEKTKDAIENSVSPRGNQNFWCSYSAINLTVCKAIEARDLEAWNVVWERSNLTVDDLGMEVDRLTEEVAKVHKDIKILEDELKDAVLTDRDANITASKWFIGVLNVTEELNAIRLEIETVAGIDIDQLLNDTYRRDEPQPIEGAKSFHSGLYVDGDATVGTLNHLYVKKDVWRIEANQTIAGETIFSDLVAVNGDVAVNTVNYIDVDEETVWLDRDVTIDGSKKFNRYVKFGTVNLAEHGLVDGVDPSKLSANVLTIDGGQEVVGNLTFKETLVVEKDVQATSLSSVNVSQLYSKTAFVNRETFVNGTKTFAKLSAVNAEVQLDGLVNGLNTTEIFTKTKPHYFTSYKHFYYMKANYVEIDGNVSGVHVPRDLITLTTDQTVAGSHYFLDGITVLGDIVLNGTVDVIDLSELSRLCLQLGTNKTYVAGNVTFFSNITVTGPIFVDGTVNGFDIGTCFNDMVFEYEEEVVISAPKYFSSDLNCSGGFQINRPINGFHFPDDFISLNSDQNITGHKTFGYVKFLADLTISGSVDAVNLTDLFESSVTLSTAQNLTTNLNFIDGIRISADLVLTDGRTVDGLDVSNELVCRNGENVQNILGLKYLDQVEVGKLEVKDELWSDNVDGIDVSILADLRVTLTTDQHLAVDWTFGNNTVKNLTVLGDVNSRNLSLFAEDVMSLTKNQWVVAKKYFTGFTPDMFTKAHLGIRPTFRHAFALCRAKGVACKLSARNEGYVAYNLDLLNRLRFTVCLTDAKSFEGINGYKLNEIAATAVKIYDDSTVTGKFSFAHTLWVGDDVSVGGLVDGFNVTEIFLYGIRHRNHGTSQSMGDKIFVNGFHANGNLETSTVNDFLVPNHTLTVSTNQIITDEYTFNKSLKVVSSVDNSEKLKVFSLNDSGQSACFDLSDFAIYAAKIDGNQTINGDVVFNETLMVEGGVIAESLIDDVNVAQLYNATIFMDGSRPFIGDLLFQLNSTVIVSGNIEVKSLNGFDFSDLAKHTLRVNGENIVLSTKDFSHVTIEGILKSDKLTTESLIGGVNVNSIANDALYLDRNEVVHGVLVFEDNATVEGDIQVTETVNGLNLEADIITVGTDQNITATKTLFWTRFKDDVYVEGNVNGHNLTELFADTLLTVGGQNVSCYKHIRTAMFSNLQCRSLNGMNTDNYVTLNTNQTIQGLVNFIEPVSFNHVYVAGLVNGKNITEIYSNALFKDVDETVNTALTFYGLVTFKNEVKLRINRTFGGIDLSWLYNDRRLFTQYASSELSNLTDSGNKICATSNALHHQLQKSASFVDYIEHPQTSESLPKLKHFVNVKNKLIGIQEMNVPCSAPDTFVAFTQNDSLTGMFTAGNVTNLVSDGHFVLFQKSTDDCPFSPSPHTFLIDVYQDDIKVVTFPDEVSNATNSHLVVTNFYVFVSFAFGSYSQQPNILYRIDPMTHQISKIHLPSPAFSDEVALVWKDGKVVFIQSENKQRYSNVQIDEIANDSSVSNSTLKLTLTPIKNLVPVVLDNHIHLVSYIRSSAQSISYKFPPLPQPASFTLFGLEVTGDVCNLVIRQAFPIDAKSIKVFSITLGTITTNYILFVTDSAIKIYIHHGVSNYELSGIIDLSSALFPGEIIWLATILNQEVIPSIVVQTSDVRTFFYPPSTNGWALKPRRLIPCH